MIAPRTPSNAQASGNGSGRGFSKRKVHAGEHCSAASIRAPTGFSFRYRTSSSCYIDAYCERPLGKARSDLIRALRYLTHQIILIRRLLF